MSYTSRSGFPWAVSPADAAAAIPAGSHMIASPCCATPTTLLEAVAERSEGRGWTLSTGLVFEHPPALIERIADGHLAHRTWHPAGQVLPLVESGVVDYVPLRASRVPAMLERWQPDVALVRITPPDRHGWCSLGPSVSYPLPALHHAKVRIAEIDPCLPRTWGQSMVPAAWFDVVVESRAPMPVYRPASRSAAAGAIAGHVISLLPDRPVLQIGIGAIPEAIVHALHDQRVGDLCFTGLGCDGMVALFEADLIDTRRSGGPPLRAPDLLGTDVIMDFADDNPLVGVFPSTSAQSVLHLAANERLVSINAALEIDLSGQVNSEHLRGAQASGTGGSLDFVEGAIHSPGGLRIVVLPATAGADGRFSRIVGRLPAGTPVSLPKGQVDVVITEHGVAHLEGRSLRERAEALIAIAAPQHRAALTEGVAR